MKRNSRYFLAETCSSGLVTSPAFRVRQQRINPRSQESRLWVFFPTFLKALSLRVKQSIHTDEGAPTISGRVCIMSAGSEQEDTTGSDSLLSRCYTTRLTHPTETRSLMPPCIP